MRLTLHWLLAYLHNVLSPSDTEAMNRKIQESDLASGLIQRMETIERKLRMNAPKVDAKGLAGDANNVADYLDSTLPSDRVSDFERICLDSDMHLAEVASCHRILAMILGKPADISDTMRQRMYAVGQVADIVKKSLAHNGKSEKGALQRDSAATGSSDALDSASGASAYAYTDSTGPDENGEVAVVRTNGLPEYLRTKPSASMWPALFGTALALLLIVGGLRIAGPFDGKHPVLGRLLGGAPQKVAQQDENSKEKSTTDPKDTAKKSDKEHSKNDSEDASVEATETDKAGKKKETVIAKAGEKETVSKAKETEEATVTKVLGKDAIVVDEGTDKEPVPEKMASEKEPESPRSPIDPENLLPEGPARGVTAADPEKTEDGAEIPPVGAPAAPPKTKGLAEPIHIARYTSDGQALAQFARDKQQWLRVPERSMLSAGSRFTVLPTFRPQISLPTGVNIVFHGESAFELQSLGDDGKTPSVFVRHGRFQIVTQGAAGGTVNLNLGGVTGKVTLSDAASILAVEVKPFLVPGTRLSATAAIKDDASKGPAPAESPSPDQMPAPEEPLLAVELSAIGGGVTWTKEGVGTLEVEKNYSVAYLGGEGGEVLGPYVAPDWMDPRMAGLFDSETSLLLSNRLVEDRSLQITLEELHNDRKVEVRSLAALSLAAIGHYDHVQKEFSDPRQYSYWTAEMDAMRRGLALGGKDRESILVLFQALGPTHGGDLLEMLQGYNPAQLAAGSAKHLVDSLESNELDVRLFAFENLRKITGATFSYRPEKKLEQNKKFVIRWREYLKEGKVVYAVEPSPFSLRKTPVK